MFYVDSNLIKTKISEVEIILYEIVFSKWQKILKNSMARQGVIVFSLCRILLVVFNSQVFIEI